MDIRNIAIIAHVDHGKTTLVDGLLKQAKTFRQNEVYMTQELILDSNDQERERGITILAKNTAVTYKGTKINIIDTPGHADFGGEVERTLNMADGVLLLVDAQEGPMPQTKFVLRKALELNLQVVVVINKIDKPNANIETTLNKIYDLFLELATNEAQLDFKVVYAIGRDEKAWIELPQDATKTADLEPVFETILNEIPAPEKDINAPFQMLVTSLDWDEHKGKYAIGRIKRGKINAKQELTLINRNGNQETVKIDKIYVNQGLARVETDHAVAGEIVLLTGIPHANIGDTLTDPSTPEALPSMKIAEPTLSISMGANTSPLKGTEGQFLTSRQILNRIEKELQTNVAMKFEIDANGQYILSGRGELHLSVFLENMRREGFEIEVGKPQVITKKIDGVEMEPIEELTIDVEEEYVGGINSELGKRRAQMISHDMDETGYTRLIFEISTRNLLGLRSTLMTISKGTAIVNSSFLRYEHMQGTPKKLRKGVLIATEKGKAMSYGLNVAQEKGPLFIGPQEMVYGGMIVGINGREQDLEINVCKGKNLTNTRSSGEDEAIILTPPLKLSLEQALNFLEDDELLEITPESLRLRKKLLDPTQRYRALRNAKNS
ncbi:MAG: translational GTPase TypA [Patescibacteria group bacterium]